MSEAPALPTPSLPGVDPKPVPNPGASDATSPTASQPFAPPTVPMSSPPDAPAPVLSTAVPSLPPVGTGGGSAPSTAAATPLVAPLAAPVDHPAGPTGPAPPTPPITPITPATPSTSTTGRRTVVAVKVLALALLVGACVWGYVTFSGSAAQDPVLVPDPTATTAPAPGSPLVAPINDAQEVVDDINDRPDVDDALSELDLDPTGQPTADSAPPSGDEAGEGGEGDEGDASVVDALTFTYSVTRSIGVDDSTTSTYLINVESGDFSRVRDGVEVRRIDGVLSERLPERGGWKLADDADAPLQPLGIDGVPVTRDALPIEMSPHMLSMQDDGIVGATMVLDVAGYRTAQPDSWQAWADRWGVADQPEPADGTLRIFVKQRSDGALHRVTIGSELDGWTVDYEFTSWITGAVPVVLN